MRGYKDPNVSAELATEIFSSRIGRKMGFPLLEVKVIEFQGKFGILMEYLPEKAHPNLKNINLLRMALAFEEWILNVDMKEDHVLAKDEIGYVIDHGHSLSTWKPTYLLQELLYKRVSRFDMWSTYEHLKEGLEIIDGIKESEIKDEMEGAFDEILQSKACSLFTPTYAKEVVETNLKLLKLRKDFLKRDIGTLNKATTSLPS
ncbi:hypothetical protein [Sulfuracidifex metallicus]|jgi:hypothetical protein|uniref:Uncharacterized protein n=1 Tax=Sulfuracidifex metallicus DSM 6482 = JCM 9184 TaxID=523847 RepID=A0A6A9QHW5_SULME|nr:hypothetical protein [Sulfuracidifex metallicus]MUN28847.1 hypothetical protein [Sulfuracidifex metallicus DSM 6482 = JCM 9184]